MYWYQSYLVAISWAIYDLKFNINRQLSAKLYIVMGKKQSKSSTSNVKQHQTFIFPDELMKLNDDNRSYQYIPYPDIQQDDKVITIGKFFDKNICDSLIKTVTDWKVLECFEQKGTKDYAARYNDRFSITNEQITDVIWSKLKSCLNQDQYILKQLKFENAKGLNPQLRIYRYEKGHYFDKHYDESVHVTGLGTTQWTLLIYLSGGEDLVGGDTIFYSAYEKVATNVHPMAGLALLHKHGDDCLLHEAQMVERGIKWILRSDVVF